MNQSTVEHISDSDILLIFRGAFLYLAPLTIPLSLVVMLQNLVIFLNYFKDRKKWISSLFMAIAVSDILRAQGELVLSVISILAYTGQVEVTVLYKSLVYYILTALPGVNCSKVFNLVMSVAITVQVVNPFTRLDTKRLKKVVTFFCSVILVLHISDAIVVVVVHPSLVVKFDESDFLYLNLLLLFIVPGAITTFSIFCKPDGSGRWTCDHFSAEINTALFRDGATSVGAVFFLVPPIVVLICMIIQVIYLKRSLREEEEEESTVLIPNTARHVSITVLFTSLLFFICNSTYILLCLLIWFYYDNHKYNEENYSDKLTDIGAGVMIGFTELTLPLLNALLYPVILICRKEELKRRYVDYWRKVTFWCRHDYEETVVLN